MRREITVGARRDAVAAMSKAIQITNVSKLRLEIAPLWLRWPIYSSLIFVALVALTWNGKSSELGLTTCAAIAAGVGSVYALVDRDNRIAGREALKDLSP